MKKLLSLALVLATVLNMSVTAFAQEITGNSGSTDITYDVSESYVVTIPDSMTIGTPATVSVSDVMLAKDYNLAVSVSSTQYDNGWKLKNNDDTIGYTLKIDDKDVANNGIVITVESGETGTKTLVTALDGTAKYSGSYTDILTFTVAQQFVYDATSKSADELKAAVKEVLDTGEKNLSIKLSPNADASMTQAIGQGMIDAGVEDSTIDLTLSGITAIPDRAFGLDEIGGTIYGVGLKTLSLPDATSIGVNAFQLSKLVSIFAPKVTTIGAEAFVGCQNLTLVDMPETTTIGTAAFFSCATLTSVNFPKATVIDCGAFWDTSITNLTLTAEGTIVLDESVFDKAGKNNLVLNTDKQNEVTDGNTWQGFTFKSITFVDTTN